MRYIINYQYMSQGSSRPLDNGEIVEIEATDKTGCVLLPDIGDYVHIDNSADGGKRANIHGKVKSRLFSYVRLSDENVTCIINIVVGETLDDWDKLIKQ